MRYSYLSHLICPLCGERFNPANLQTFCPACPSPLLARYDLQSLRTHLDRDEIARRQRGMNRWHELLPTLSPWNVITLGEGDTPLLPLPSLGSELGLPKLYLKDESFNPTGSFKARGMGAAVSKARELGVERLVVPTAGNAGGALAAYAARAGLQATVIMPKDTPSANIKESRFAGAETLLVDGLISDAAVLARARAEQEGYFDVSTFKEPYRVEGKKVMGLELAEAFGWYLPDVIVYPTGGGTGLVGIWKAMQELAELGWLETKAYPRLVAVQANGCAPVVQAFEKGSATCTFWPGARTRASGLRVPKPFADRLILEAIRESGGVALTVSDESIAAAQRTLARREGIFTAPEGAATLAGLLELRARGLVDSGERIILLNTGTGLKYLEQIEPEN
jgi:threonine synthase